MSRYIDADKLVKDALRFYCTDYYSHILNMIDNAPTIDLVRCGECGHWNPHKELAEHDDYGESRPCSVMFGKCTYADDFCSYGQRGKE